MSAYIETFAHINYIAQYAVKRQEHFHPSPFSYYYQGERKIPTVDEIGQILWDENYRSVNYRYNEDNKAPIFVSMSNTRSYDPAQIFKAINSLEYQSCETDDWDQTEAAAILDAIRRKACHFIIDQHGSVAWTLDNTPAEAVHSGKLKEQS